MGVANGVEGELSAPPKPLSLGVAMDYSRFRLVNSGHYPPLLVTKEIIHTAMNKPHGYMWSGDQVLKTCMISKAISNSTAQFGVF